MMKKLILLSLLVAGPVFAKNRLDLLFDIEGVRRTGATKSFEGGTRFDPSFSTGGGIGAGFNWFFSDRMSIETKIAGIESTLHFRVIQGDAVINIDYGKAQLYPISAVLQWHPMEHGTLRPYIGGGVVHVFLRNINRQIRGTAATGVEFKNPTGLVVNAGLEVAISSRWSLYGDARYVPIETKSRVVFEGTGSATTLNVRPLIVSTGIAYHF